MRQEDLDIIDAFIRWREALYAAEQVFKERMGPFNPVADARIAGALDALAEARAVLHNLTAKRRS